MSAGGGFRAAPEAVSAEAFIEDVLFPAIDYLDRSDFTSGAPVGSEIEHKRRTPMGAGDSVVAGLEAYIGQDDGEVVGITLYSEAKQDELADGLIELAGFEEGETDEDVLGALDEDRLGAWLVSRYVFNYPANVVFDSYETYELQDEDGHVVVWSEEDIDESIDDTHPEANVVLDATESGELNDAIKLRAEELSNAFTEENRVAVCAILLQLGVPHEMLKL